MRAFEAGWGGAVWKTLGQPIQNVSSRFGGIQWKGNRGVGFMNCSNGWKMALTIPKDKYGTVNGSYVETADGIGVATGWGKEANADLLRAKM